MMKISMFLVLILSKLAENNNKVNPISFHLDNIANIALQSIHKSPYPEISVNTNTE